MALTNKGSKWENKNSLFLIFAFIPALDCIAFFHMAARSENKKYKKTGYACLAINIILIVALVFGTEFVYQVQHGRILDLYDYMQTAPAMSDYVGYDYADYYDIYGKDYVNQPAYKEYKEAYDEWLNSEEVQEAKAHAYSVELLLEYLLLGVLFLYGVSWLVFLIIAFRERPKYLRELAERSMASDAFKRILNMQQSLNKNQSAYQQQQSQNQNQNPPQPQTPDSGNGYKDDYVDINSADEETLSALRGITIIDAKKAIAYREEHGGFNNVDEFFSCINAKPHIIVSLQNQLTAGEYKQLNAPGSQGRGVRKLDL